MATHTRRETVVRRIDHVLPAPTVGAELYKALACASRDYCQVTGYDKNAALPDDALTITVTDSEVVISYTVELPADGR
jgi:hypothetical protein